MRSQQTPMVSFNHFKKLWVFTVCHPIGFNIPKTPPYLRISYSKKIKALKVSNPAH